jgi:hypothetical protein
MGRASAQWSRQRFAKENQNVYSRGIEKPFGCRAEEIQAHSRLGGFRWNPI